MSTTNYQKHSTKNPIERYFLDNFNNTLISIIQQLPAYSVLDVGCGEGFTLQRLTNQKIGKKLEGVDFVQEALDLGKKIHPHLKLIKGDLYELPYENDSFDLLLCTEVLEHLEYPQKALQELIRVSKKYILLSVPHEPWFTISRILRGKNLLQLGKHPEHVQYWTSEAFEKFVSVEEVKILKVMHPFPWTMILIGKNS